MPARFAAFATPSAVLAILILAACSARQSDSSSDGGSTAAAAPAGSAGQGAVRIDSQRVLLDLRTLSADSFAGRRVATAGGLKARDYVEAAMQRARLQRFGGSFIAPAAFRRADSSSVDAANVVGFVRGTQSPNRYIVISGHYDHLGVGRAVNGDSIYNGADDNASGTAAMLELGRYFVAHPPRHSIIFVGFDAEEGGLRGARAFVETPPVPRDSIMIDINLDMVSRSPKGELYAVGTLARPVLKPFIERAQARGRVTLLTGHEGPTATGSDNWESASDHGPFNRAGIPYLYFGVEDHAGYHQPSDEFAFITPGFYVRAIETVLDVVLDLDRDLSAIAAVRHSR